MAKPVSDPWLLNADGTPDPFANNVNWDMPDLPDLDDPQPDIDPVLDAHDNLDPEIVTSTPEPVVEPVQPVEPPEPEEPETMDLEDGTQLVLQKDKKGWWEGSVIGQAGSAQVYKGQTKNKLVMEILKAQANATKKIREQNAKLKFGSAPAKPVAQPTALPTNVRQLTAEEVFEYKTMWESDPVAANDFLLQKTRGITMDQVLDLAKRGAEKGAYAANQLTAEQANKTFLANNPDYYPDENSSNFKLLIQWLSKFKLGEVVRKGEEEAAFDKLLSSGNYTAENLEEAFQDLSTDGLMIQAPRRPITSSPARVEPPPPVAVQPNEPAPAPRPDSRIVSQVTRPRAAALGISKNDVTPVKSPETPTAPSVEDLNDMTDEEIARLMASVRKLHAQQGRRSN